MTTMRCETVRDALPALLRGSPTAAETQALREHVAGCAGCAAEWRIAEALHTSREDAPDGLAARVSAALSQSPARVGTPASRTLPRAIRWSAGSATAAAATIALILAWPERAPEESASRELALGGAQSTSPSETDPFLDEDLFAADAAPLAAQLDDVLEGVDPAVVAPGESSAGAAYGDGVPLLAMDLGSPLGDWPGADGTTAGAMTLDDLTYEEMQLLLSEMDT